MIVHWRIDIPRSIAQSVTFQDRRDFLKIFNVLRSGNFEEEGCPATKIEAECSRSFRTDACVVTPRSLAVSRRGSMDYIRVIDYNRCRGGGRGERGGAHTRTPVTNSGIRQALAAGSN